MTNEQAGKFWEQLFAITAYAERCRETLEKVFPLPEGEDPPKMDLPDSPGDARSTILFYLPKIKEHIAELEELLTPE